MNKIIRCFLSAFIVVLVLTGCTVNEENKETTISIETSIDETIKNTDGSIPYKFGIKQFMDDGSTREYTGVIHVKPDGTLFTYGQVDNDVEGLISTLGYDHTEDEDYFKTLIMRSNFDQVKDSPTFIHKIKWVEDHFEISNQETIPNK